ncbi:TonB-dependent receptor [Steroidobacter agaridevorans]|uniref:TonB-dependent receptor n=1 Tax=Steroidobacter agaridevorans TaxID=2695856 RepID=A0A829YIG2_9GAMM|nr:TonB-dependent receptor [Steroidobacter agaridevorans]GFE82306.1 TonB-dependent receptor [Steroidobacter agaridevorans]
MRRRPALFGACALVAVTTAAAQEADTEQVVEQVVVTGTSIRGVASAGAPVIAMDREELVATGLATSSDLARALPQVLNLGADESRLGGAQDGAANATRVSGINLRGIGNEATLLLINGRRLAPAGVIKSLYDPNVIASAAIERLEVVVDGASAIYGSDAVAGVVNIITRNDFEGAETMARYGVADGTSQKIISQNFGFTWDTGSVFAAYEHNERDNLSGADRDFASNDRRARGGSDARPGLASPGNIVIGTTRYPLPAGPGTGLDPAQLTAGAPNRFDEGSFADLLPNQERDSFFLDARQAFGRLDVWYQGWLSEREFDERVAPASGQLRVPNTNAFFVAPAGIAPPAFVNVEYRFLAEDADPRLSGYENAQQNAIGAGYDLGADWRIEGYANLSKNRGFQRRGAITNGAALTAALASNNPATAFNPFGDGTFNVTNNPALVDLIIANRDTHATSEARDLALKADGPLFSLPGGDVRVAVGMERHDNEFSQRLDANNVLASGAVTTKNILNRRHNTSFFGEVFVPVVSEEQSIPGIHSLSVSVAGRREEYSDFGSTTDPKVGVIWRPISSLTARATYGTSFRAPSLVDTSEQIHNIFIQTLTDPASGTGVTRGIYHNGGRGSLKPEEATTWSVGLDWAPMGALQGLTASLTYYDVDYTDRIDVVLNTALTNASVYGPYVIRRPPASDATATAAFNALVQSFLSNPDLQSPAEPVSNINAIIDGRRANLGSMKQQGIDLNLGYSFNTSFGDWRMGFDAAKILDLTRSIAPGLPYVDVLDTYSNPVDLRARASVGWRLNGWSANAYLNYVDSYRNTAITPNVEVDSYKTVDASIVYDFGEERGALSGVSLSVNGQNLLDEDPPVVLNGIVSWDNQNVSPLGRFVSFVLTKRW